MLAYKYAAKCYTPPSREGAQIRLALRPVVADYSHTLAKDFGPLALKAVRETWIAEGIARRYFNQRIGRVIRAWRWAVKNEMVPADCWHALKAVAGLRAGRSAARATEPVRPVSDALYEAAVAEIAAMVSLDSPEEVCYFRRKAMAGGRVMSPKVVLFS